MLENSEGQQRAQRLEQRPRRVQVIVIGAGQAGLAAGRYLAQAGVDFLILEAADRVGDVWRNRWDSLRLFTAAEFAGLPGLPYPGDPDALPTKDQLADYLETYASHFRLPVRFNTSVERLERDGDRYVITTSNAIFEADHVVVATGSHQATGTPAWADSLAPGIVQIRSSDYKNPSQLAPGGVLVVGAGNSGAELALEAAAAGHRVWLSGRDVGQVPRFFRFANGRPFWFLATRVFTMKTPIGRKIRKALRAGHSGPLVRIRSKEIPDAGILRVPRVTNASDGRPALADGRVLDVANILWCTGMGTDFSWIRLPVFEPDGYPRHDRGRVVTEPGLYFVGLTFQYSLSSGTLVGVGRDAALVSSWIVERLERSTTTSHAGVAHAPA